VAGIAAGLILLSRPDGYDRTFELKSRVEDMASLHVMIVEDEPLVAMAMEMLVEDAGGVAVGPFSTVKQALGALQSDERIDCALLDYNLGREPSWPVAEALAARGVAFAFTSGEDIKDIAKRFPGRPIFAKPIDEERLKRFVRQFARGE
jgi:CheY-like chemotaxis protein